MKLLESCLTRLLVEPINDICPCPQISHWEFVKLCPTLTENVIINNTKEKQRIPFQINSWRTYVNKIISFQHNLPEGCTFVFPQLKHGTRLTQTKPVLVHCYSQAAVQNLGSNFRRSVEGSSLFQGVLQA